MLFPAFLRQGWSSLKFSLKSKILNENGQLVGGGGRRMAKKNKIVKKKKLKKLPNIGIKVTEVKCETTRRYVQPLVSNLKPWFTGNKQYLPLV